MENRIITIKDAKSGSILASAEEGVGTQLFEGAWYFDPDAVDMTHLVVTERIYICPYKGTCYWVDLITPDYEVKDVAFTYFKINVGYEFIQDRIAFYAGRREGTEQTAAPVKHRS